MKNWRINLIFIFLIIFSATIIGRLIFLQVLRGDLYRALSQGLHSSFAEYQGNRGEIFLKGGEPLAINMNWPYVFVHPRLIEDAEITAQKLASILKLEESFVIEKLNKDSPYSLIKRKLTSSEVEALKNINLTGVFIDEEKGRYYPQESLASQLVGFLGAEKTGQYGLEQSYDDVLTAEEGLLKEKKGSDLVLSLDYDIQFEAERLLQKIKEDLDIEGGQIIVMEPDSGGILAMADLSNFNPSYYEEYARQGNLEIFKNKATQGLFEPGSVFKPINMAAALQEGKVSPQTTYIDEGSVQIGFDTIYNYDQRIHGTQTMTNVLEKSINTGSVFVQKQLGQNLFLKYLEKFGLFEPTGIDVQETYSENREIKTGREINLATASFGQGIEMTPLQLVRAYAAIANGGELINPYLVEKEIDSNNVVRNLGQENKQKDENRKIISSKTASQLTAMLVSVVENGFAKAAGVPGYFIAGKTGTAQVSFGALGIDKKGYSDKTIQTFVGFAPAFNPEFLILVKLDNPKTRTAEYSAVPLFRQLAEYIINLNQIPPDYE